MESPDERSRTRLTRAHVDACPSCTLWHAYCTHTDRSGTGDNKGGKKEEVALLVETLALGSVGQSTQKNYLAKWNTCVKERKAQGKWPWLHALDDPDKALTEQLEFMSSRRFVHNNQQSIVRGYLAAINFFTRCLQVGNYRCRIACAWQWIKNCLLYTSDAADE